MVEWIPLNENVIQSIANAINNYQNLAPQCGGTNKTVGDIVHMSTTPTGGVAPYTVIFKKDNLILNQVTGVAEAQSRTNDYTTVTADIGTHTFSVTITDSCVGTGGPKTNTESCSVDIVAPVLTCDVPAVNLVVS